MSDTIQIMITMVIYMAAVIAIGIAFAKRANKSSEDYFLGGRGLGPWVTAMSAEASDMSGWLLMGAAGGGLLVRHRRRVLDGHRPCCGYLCKLADHLKKAAPVQRKGGERPSRCRSFSPTGFHEKKQGGYDHLQPCLF